MLQIKNVKVYDLEESVIASRNAFRTELPEYTDEEFQKSLRCASTLANTAPGSGEQTWLSGVRVSFDIIYPNYISPELQRYHWIDIVTSSSKMHKLTSMDMGTCFNEYVTDDQKFQMAELVAQYNRIKDEKPVFYDFRLGPNRILHVDGFQQILYAAFMLVVSNCPQGVQLFMRVSTNYLQLKTIYRQRKHHKLKEDWGAFCDMVRSLPYAKEFITGEE